MPIALSSHFSTAEPALANLEAAPQEVRAAAQHTVTILEAVRAVLGVPLVVTSFWRSPEHNAEVGGVNASQHLTGNAADVIPKGLALGTAYDRLRPMLEQLPEFGQMIFYPVKGHIHISTTDGTNSRRKVLFAYPDASKPGGTRYEFPNDAAVNELPRGLFGAGGATPWWVLPLLLVVVLVGLYLTL
jgi:hypothetical protein